ncbi:MAG: substrate-binding domain-containing protein [Candidatus Omnitrophica bacterium]|nr:substrate-binding domain-containing protein [Candidatus Omnitrophota bacterium]
MTRQRLHIVFLEDLQSQSVREVFMGAAGYAAERPHWDFDPWPVSAEESPVPSPEDLDAVDGILTSELAISQVHGIQRLRWIPRVYFLADYHHPNASCVSLDERGIGRLAAEHLLSRGYRHCVFIGCSSKGWSKQRGEGFALALASARALFESHEFPEETLPVFWSWNMTRHLREVLKLLGSISKPCGIFAANDVIAYFVIQASRQLRLRIPEDIGVVGVDDDPVPNAATRLTISSIHPPFREVGRRAAELLDTLCDSQFLPSVRIQVSAARVAVRASTDGFMTDDALVRKAQSYIESHRHERVSVCEVTRAVGSNRVTLGKHFQRELDVGLLEYIRKRRIEHCREKLQMGEMNVEEVARSFGFSSSSYFSRVFKKVTGLSPGRLSRGMRVS